MGTPRIGMLSPGLFLVCASFLVLTAYLFIDRDEGRAIAEHAR
jgi:hypothetical protein